VVTGVFVHELPTRLAGDLSFGWPAVVAGRWWTVVTSLMLTRNWFMAATMPVAVLVALGWYERRAGALRALAVAAIGHTTGSVVVATGAAVAGASGNPVLIRAAANLDYGASMVVAAALGATASRLHHRRLALAGAAGVVLLVPLHHQMADWAHLVAFPTGFLVDRAHQPNRRLVVSALTAAVTGWLLTAGPSAVTTATETVRFRSFPTVTEPGARPPQPEATITNVSYLARELGDRPAVARVLVPARSHGPYAVIIFFHGVPGVPDDWLVGGALTNQLARQPWAASTLAVLVDTPGFHNAKAGWRDVPGQPTTRSIERDLLPALARRWAVDLRVRHVAAVGAGRGVTGAVALARTDRRVGWLIALDPSRPVPRVAGVARYVTGHPASAVVPVAARLRPQPARRRWGHWRAAMPGAFAWLTAHDFQRAHG
jgi:hypothetical protein